MEKQVAMYERKIEIFLSTIGGFKVNRIVDVNNEDYEKNRVFIMEKMIQIESGNVDRVALEKAIDNILPYYTFSN